MGCLFNMSSRTVLPNSGSDICIKAYHEIQNHVNDNLIADRGIDHTVVNGTVGPFDAEILLNEIHAFSIDGIDELFGFVFTLAAGQQSPDFILSRGVKKHTQRVFPALEELLRTPPDDDGVSFFGDLLNDVFGNLQNAFAVNYVELVRIEATFVASP